MELSELKTAWKKVADRSADENRLEEDQLREILSNRGKGIISRLDRNVKIGFGLLALFILLTFIDKLLPNSILNNGLFEEVPQPPAWLLFSGWIVSIFIAFTFISFAWKYYRVNVPHLAADHLPTALNKLLIVLGTFKKQFYLALFLFIFEAGLSFAIGMYHGYTSVSETLGDSFMLVALVIIIMLFILGVFVAILTFIFHLGFKNLYGKYHQQLKDTLHELNELED
ncbi:hypothetical protein [Prolixibacter sp. NT017]|uniref:hypothetical protein n=1 Tax=Prolixibacter sp. NT017 TaxID=2652390 RepID=UPI001272CAC1|nr:hypothetical protein [Prolixibacter sp. NT017]GET26812.1 hypothetical protein NT017_31410 [Prolixibacter sp. NT017]